MNFLRLLFSDSNEKNEISDLKKRLDESEKNVEKLLEMVNILATFDEKLAKDLRTVASHVALMEMSMVDKKKQNMVVMKRKSNDDDMIN